MKIEQGSSLNERPTPRQVRAIARLCTVLGISEPLEERPSNRWEARDLIYDLLQEVKAKKYARKA